MGFVLHPVGRVAFLQGLVTSKPVSRGLFETKLKTLLPGSGLRLVLVSPPVAKDYGSGIPFQTGRHRQGRTKAWLLLGNILHCCLLWFSGKSPQKKLLNKCFLLVFQREPRSGETTSKPGKLKQAQCEPSRSFASPLATQPRPLRTSAGRGGGASGTNWARGSA